jgi:hypothetical protein
MHRKASFLFITLFAIFTIVMIATPPARTDVVGHARIVRLSFVEGDVAYQRPGSVWQRAMANLPIQQGLQLRTDTGYAEVEFETGLVVRLAQNTLVEFTGLSLIDGGKVTSLKLDQGTIIATANLGRGDQFSVASGNLNVAIPHSGRFRIDAAGTQNYVTSFHGKVDVANGSDTTTLESGKTLHFGGTENESSVDRSPKADAFDKWVAKRDEAQQAAQANAGDFVRQRDYAFDVADLYNYGLWYNVAGYGMLWQPYGLGPSWMPFSNGMWISDDPTANWMWMSAESWGWLPYHYGGWVNVPGDGWFWAPQNLGTFLPASARFVNVANQVAWTPMMATPTNPGKIKTHTTTPPIQIVFAGTAQNGVITAGPRGQINSSATVKLASGPAPSFAQPTAPNAATLVSSGVTVTGRAPVGPTNTSLTYAPHGAINANNGSHANQSAPLNGRPTAFAPHTAPMPVQHAPSTFENSSVGSRNSGVTQVNPGGSGASSSSHSMPTSPSVPGSPTGSSAGSGHPAGSAGAGPGAGAPSTGGAQGGAPTGKH